MWSETSSKSLDERLSIFLVLNDFVKGNIDSTLFTMHVDNRFLIVQIYVDDIILGFTNEKLDRNFESCMKKEFEMSM